MTWHINNTSNRKIVHPVNPNHKLLSPDNFSSTVARFHLIIGSSVLKIPISMIEFSLAVALRHNSSKKCPSTPQIAVRAYPNKATYAD